MHEPLYEDANISAAYCAIMEFKRVCLLHTMYFEVF